MSFEVKTTCKSCRVVNTALVKSPPVAESLWNYCSRECRDVAYLEFAVKYNDLSYPPEAPTVVRERAIRREAAMLLEE